MTVISAEYNLNDVTVRQLMSFLKDRDALQTCHICNKSSWITALGEDPKEIAEDTPVAVFVEKSTSGAEFSYYHVICTCCGVMQQISTYFVQEFNTQKHQDER